MPHRSEMQLLDYDTCSVLAARLSACEASPLLTTPKSTLQLPDAAVASVHTAALGRQGLTPPDTGSSHWQPVSSLASRPPQPHPAPPPPTPLPQPTDRYSFPPSLSHRFFSSLQPTSSSLISSYFCPRTTSFLLGSDPTRIRLSQHEVPASVCPWRYPTQALLHVSQAKEKKATHWQLANPQLTTTW